MAREFIVPGEIISGSGALDMAEGALKLLGKKALIVTDKVMIDLGNCAKVEKALTYQGIEYSIYSDICGEPTDTMIEKGLQIYKDENCDFLVALGGGSPIDSMKAIGSLVVNGGSISDYMGKVIDVKMPPMAAIPTTAGTGSEVTAFSVITDTSRNYKLTVFSYELLPKYALLDPEMIMSVPPMVAASCGIDALIHAWEAYTSLGASPFSDAMAEKAMELIGGNIRRFVANRKDEEAACAMMSGSMFAGIAFAWARLGDVHAMSHPVSAFFGVQHGVANSILLPVIVEYNALADHGRYEKIYNYISEEKEPVKDFKPEMLVEEIKKLNASLGIPKTLSEVGVTEDKIPQMAADAMKSGNIAANPRQTTLKDVEMLYRKAL